MSKRKDRSKVVATLKLTAARKPYYYQVYLWSDIEHLREYFDLEPEDTTLAMTSFESWYVDTDTGQVYINPKLGEIHFAMDNWNVNIIAHEVQHAIIHRMRLIWPPAHLIMLDEYADAEEEIAYEMGNWTERVSEFLWTNDPGDISTNPAPWQRVSFNLPRHTSDINFPRTGVKAIKPKAKNKLKEAGNEPE